MANTKNINSFAENMRRTITALKNTLNLMEAVLNSISTNDTFVTYDYEQLKDGVTKTYLMPSYTSLINRLKAVENNLSNIANGKGTLTTTDGTRRQIAMTNLPLTPNRVTNLTSPTTFDIDANWFFEDLMFPGVTVPIDLTGKIDDDSDRVKVARIIVDATNSTAVQFWNNNLASNDYEYATLKELLNYNGIPYSEDIETIELPLISNSLYGQFQIIADPETIDGNVWYTLDTLAYATIDENGITQNKNNILSIGDRIAYNNTLFSVIGVDLNNNKVRLKIINGSSFPGVYSLFSYYQDPFRSKVINVRFGHDEYDFIYIKGVNENFNLLSNEWSTPVKFYSGNLVNVNDTTQSFDDFYRANIVDWGEKWIAEAKEKSISAFYGHTPNAPTLIESELRVVQINTLINAAMDTASIRQTAADIEATKSHISSLKKTIASQLTLLQSISDLTEYNTMQLQIATNIQDLKNDQAKYTTLVNTFQTDVKNNSAVLENPKYHIRGFFAVPEYKYLDGNNKYPENIIGFDIAYRYIKEDNTSNELNTFDYTDIDGTSTVTGTFTDWNITTGKLKHKAFNETTQMYEWEIENVGDGGQLNINQIDIPISKGEKVEIKVRSISECGWPYNPLRSGWSNSIIKTFPDNLETSNAIADLVTEINDDALNIAINNNLDAGGVTSHLDDTIANTNSVNGISFKHKAENIAYEDADESSNLVETISLQDKIADLEARIKLLEKYLNDQTDIVDPTA